MAIGFMTILAIAVEERLDAKTGAILLWPLIAVGVFSLLLWRWTGDLRLYGWVQFFPCVALPVLFLHVSTQIQRHILLADCRGAICPCKAIRVQRRDDLFCRLDFERAYLKHVAAAAACFAILRYFQKRQPIRGIAAQVRGRRGRRIDFRAGEVLAFLSVEAFAVRITDDGNQTTPIENTRRFYLVGGASHISLVRSKLFFRT